jgi:hypothetical protein
MRFILLFFVLMLSFHNVASSQKSSPVIWSFSVVKSGNNAIELTASATMKDDWVIYSQDTEEGGPIPTSFTINNSSIVLDEKSRSVSEFDEIFEVTVKKFKNKAVFSKTIQGDFRSGLIQGSVTYMTCDGQKCLPPATVEFNININ